LSTFTILINLARNEEKLCRQNVRLTDLYTYNTVNTWAFSVVYFAVKVGE